MSAENISYDLKRFAGIKRDYTPEEVERLRGSIKIEHSLCKHQSKKLWNLLNTESYVNTLGSLSGNHAVQHAKAGLKAIYLSGWQVAADANSAGEMYPDQSLYTTKPSHHRSGPRLGSDLSRPIPADPHWQILGETLVERGSDSRGTDNAEFRPGPCVRHRHASHHATVFGMVKQSSVVG